MQEMKQSLWYKGKSYMLKWLGMVGKMDLVAEMSAPASITILQTLLTETNT